MKIDPKRPVSDQLESRLHQCSFFKRNHLLVGIELSESQMKLLDTFGNRLGKHFESLFKSNYKQNSHIFTIINFDNLIKKIFNIHNKCFNRVEVTLLGSL
jgi:hypothetical protein